MEGLVYIVNQLVSAGAEGGDCEVEALVFKAGAEAELNLGHAAAKEGAVVGSDLAVGNSIGAGDVGIGHVTGLCTILDDDVTVGIHVVVNLFLTLVDAFIYVAVESAHFFTNNGAAHCVVTGSGGKAE